MLTISRLDGDTPLSYNGVMPIGRDQLGPGDAASGLWTLLCGDQVSTSLAMCHRALVDNLAFTRAILACAWVATGFPACLVSISACVKAAIQDYLPNGRWPSVM